MTAKANKCIHTIAAVLLCALLLFAFTACATKQNATHTEPTPSPALALEEREYYGAMPPDEEALFLQLLERGLREWQIHSLNSMSLSFSEILGMTDEEIAEILAPGSWPAYGADEISEHQMAILAGMAMDREMVGRLQSLGYYTYGELRTLTPEHLAFIFPRTELVNRLVEKGYVREQVESAGALSGAGWDSYRDLLCEIFGVELPADPTVLAVRSLIQQYEDAVVETSEGPAGDGEFFFAAAPDSYVFPVVNSRADFSHTQVEQGAEHLLLVYLPGVDTHPMMQITLSEWENWRAVSAAFLAEYPDGGVVTKAGGGDLAVMEAAREEVLAAIWEMLEQYRAGTVENNALEPHFDPLPAGAMLPEDATVDAVVFGPGSEMFAFRALLAAGTHDMIFWLDRYSTGGAESEEVLWAVSAVGFTPREQ